VEARRALRQQLMKIVDAEDKRTVVQSEREDWRLHYDPGLVLREALHRYHGGKPRLPDEVAAFPPEWEEDINLMLHLLQFQRDALAE